MEKQSSKTFRASRKNHLSFNQIVKCVDTNNNPVDIIKEIKWAIESDLDGGIFQLCSHYNLPVKLNIETNHFEKLPPNVRTNRNYYSSAGNTYNLWIGNEKSQRLYYYYPDGKKTEYFYNEKGDTIDCLDDKKTFKGEFKCNLCKTSFKTKEAIMSHKITKQHIERLKKVANEKYDSAIDSIQQYNKPQMDNYINIHILVNRSNYYSKNEYKKKYEGGCKCCILISSTALTNGYGKKSSNKTKGRKKRERMINID